MEKNVFDWQQSLAETYQEFVSQFLAYAPQLFGGLALLLAGWLAAHALRLLTRKLVRSLDAVFQRAAATDGRKQDNLKRSYAVIISKLVFWTVMVFFITATANMLEWQMFSNWMNSVVIYLPNLITGLLIVLAGFLLSNGARIGVISAAHSAGVERGEALARLAQAIVLFTSLVIGIEQIGINVDFLTNVLIVSVGALIAGGALAFSLGAKTLVANVIGAQYVRKHCRVGEIMNISGIEGSVVEVTQTSIVLDTQTGRTVVPAKFFQESISHFSTKGAEDDAGAQAPVSGGANK